MGSMSVMPTLYAEPLLTSLDEFSLTRASLAFYNTEEEVDFFIKSLDRAVKILK